MRPGGPGGGSILGLLMNPQIREELDLTEDQQKQLRQLRELGGKLREEMSSGEDRPRFDRESIGKMSEEERRAMFEKMRSRMEEMQQRMAKALEDVLVPTQMKRLEQISLQQQGTRALGNKKVIDALGITSEQQAKLREIGESVRGKMEEAFRGIRDLPEAERRAKMEGMREKMEEIRKGTEQQAMAVLTDEQKAKLGELMGEPFEMEQQRFGRGGPGGGGERGGRGGPGGGGERGGRGGPGGGGERGGRGGPGGGGERGGERGERPPR